MWLPLAVFFLAAVVFCTYPSRSTRHPLTARSARRALPQARQRRRRHAAAALLPVRPPALPSRCCPADAPRSYCLVGIGVMAAGVLYWAGWRVLLPRVFGYALVPRKERLADGTVITLVRAAPSPPSRLC